MTTALNTTEEDLQFELLLCLASTFEAIQRLEQTGTGGTQSAEVYVPTQVETIATNFDQESELLEGLASTIEAIQSLLPPRAGGDGMSLDRESDEVFSITQGKWQPRSHELALSPGSD